MSNLPTPIRAVLGLAATAMEEARKLPETLPQVPVAAVTTAMQASLRVQQHIATLAAKGDELLSQLRGTSSDAPSWATFDDSPAASDAPDANPGNGHRGTAAFDRVATGERVDADEHASVDQRQDAEEATERFDIAQVGGTEPVAKTTRRAPSTTKPSTTKPSTTKPSTAKASTAKASTAKPSTAKASTAKASTTKGSPTKVSTTKPRATKASAAGDDPAGPIMAAGSVPATKPARKKPAKRSEPLEVAAKRAKPAATPNPATMAAEIVAAHEAETQSATNQHEVGPGDQSAAGTQPTKPRQAGSGIE
ncbi:MAG: hypothetical protein M3Y42_02500 [Actinomycetota bacterium]|nr:hypothetical protein [Actinomycetota bacterium]MDQ2955816.1 hypothetical protein [Actinomycetota bacterium]